MAWHRPLLKLVAQSGTHLALFGIGYGGSAVGSVSNFDCFLRSDSAAIFT